MVCGGFKITVGASFVRLWQEQSPCPTNSPGRTSNFTAGEGFARPTGGHMGPPPTNINIKFVLKGHVNFLRFTIRFLLGEAYPTLGRKPLTGTLVRLV